MVSNQYTNVALAKVSDDSLDIQHRDRIDTGERFVEQDKQRIGSQCARDFHAAPFATRQADSRAGAHMANVQLVEQVFEFLLPPGAVEIVTVLKDCKIDASWGRYPSPSLARRCIGCAVRSLPSSSILPLSAAMSPTIM
jgi:hypothetical protein